MKILKKKIIRQLPSCITEKFNGFQIIRMEYEKKVRNKFLPIAIIYDPGKSETQKVNCFSSNKVQLAFRGTFYDGKKIKHCAAWQCY